MRSRPRALLTLALLLVACGDDDGGSGTDATVPDAAVPDAGPWPDARPWPDASPQGLPVVFVAHPADKIQPTTAPGDAVEIRLEGPQRSVQAAQVIVRGSGGPLHWVFLEASPLTSPAGDTFQGVTCFRQAFIDYTGVVENEPGSAPAPAASPTADPRVPDPLIPLVDPYDPDSFPLVFDVPEARNQPVWVDVEIPAGTPPGVYTGEIEVASKRHLDLPDTVIVPLTVTVWDLELPDQRIVPTWFGAHLGNLIQYHRDLAACSGSSCWLDWNAAARTVVKRYEELAHAHRIDLGPFFVPEPETAGPCAPPQDFAAHDAALQPYLDGSYFADGVPATRVPTPFSPGVDWGLEADCTQAEYTALAAAWATHLASIGALDRAIVYAYDEPPAEVLPTLAQHSAWLQAGDPAWKDRVLVTTAPTPDTAPVLNDAVGIYCVCLRCYDGWTQSDYFGRQEWPALRQAGIQLWFYESNAQSDPYPTFAANTLLGAEPLLALWGAWYEGATGFLLWDTVAWDEEDPWGPNASWGKTGDGVLLYPGHHDGLLAPAGSPAEVTVDGPIPSYRLKQVRAGLQDWALFQLAESRGLGVEARAEVARVYGQLGGCTWQGCPEPENGSFFWQADGALMDEVRRNVAMLLIP
jgi:hypothetical protein